MEVVKAVIIKKDEYLLQLRDDNPLISFPNTWSFFGGEVDINESQLEALKRELFEELNWKPQLSNHIKKIRYEKPECNITFYLIEFNVSDDKLKLGEGQKMAWFKYDKILKLSKLSDLNQNIVAKEILFAINALTSKKYL